MCMNIHVMLDRVGSPLTKGHQKYARERLSRLVPGRVLALEG